MADIGSISAGGRSCLEPAATIASLLDACEASTGRFDIEQRGARMRRHALVTGVLAALVLAVLASPAAAVQDPASRDDRRISLSGRVVVEEGETLDGPVVSFDGPVTIDGVVTDDVIVGSGDLRVNGRVSGDVLVFDGDAIVAGQVRGDVVSVGGRVTVESGARVGGDVVSRREPQVASGTVQGEVKRLDLESIFSGVLIAFLVYLWLAVTVSVALLGLVFVLLFPRAADATVAASRRFWPSLGWGALVGIVGPIIAVIVLATIVGIPLGGGILAALTVLAPLGYVAASLSLGRTMVKGTSTGARVGAFFAGFGILRAAALIPVLGFIVWFLACLYGLGALTIAAWRAGHAPAPQDGEARPVEAPPAVTREASPAPPPDAA
jgi:cytoskeletal protein CcmA (bactofilin family)